MPVPNGMQSRQDIRENLNALESVMDFIDTEDNYLSAMVANQVMMASKLDAIAGSGQGTSVDMDNLPIGLVGIALEDIDSRAIGRAMFDISGFKRVAMVTAENQTIESQDYVIVNSDNNGVIEGPSTITEANSDYTGGGGSSDGGLEISSWTAGSLSVSVDDTSGSLSDSVTAFKHPTSGTDAEPLPSNTVNGTVTIQADPDNTGDVFIGGADEQPIQLSKGDSIGDVLVSDTSLIYVQTPNVGDEVNVIAE